MDKLDMHTDIQTDFVDTAKKGDFLFERDRLRQARGHPGLELLQDAGDLAALGRVLGAALICPKNIHGCNDHGLFGPGCPVLLFTPPTPRD